jgi:RNA ligase
MFYEFPRINHISEVLHAIEGAPEFIVADRGDHTVINYVVSTPDTFPPVPTAGGSAKMRAEKTRDKALRRECRGLIFDKAGCLIRRPYHKFFNLNQVDETQIDKVDLSEPHDILEKLDGSMIVPYRIRGERERVIWGTKMGDTDVATPVEAFIRKNRNYIDFFEMCESYKASPIFEWCSRQQRIVIDHPVDRLVVTAVRYMNDGTYMDYEDLAASAEEFNVPVVQRFHVEEGSDIAAVMEYIRLQEGSEGVVIRYANGHMLKIKSEWYLAIHGAKELITEEKNVVRLIVNEEIDDAKSLVLEEDRDNLTRYEADFWNALQGYSRALQELIVANLKRYHTRKDYALGAKDDDILRTATFSFFDEKTVTQLEVMTYIIDRFIKPNVNNRTKFTAMKQKIFPGLRLYL